MPALVPSPLLPIPALILPAPPRRHRRSVLPAASSASSSSPHSSRQPYYRRRRPDGPSQTPTPAPRPSSQPRDANAAAPRARSQEELEAAIYDFMCRSNKPGAFPTREELLAAGRSDLAAAVASSGGWLSLGWSSTAAEGPATTAAPRSSGGVHPDYPPETGVYYRGDLVPGSVEDDSEWEEEEEDDDDGEEEASSSGREQETEETSEVRFKAGIEGMLTRLQKDRERARPPPRSSTHDTQGQSDDAAASSGAPSHTAAGGRQIPRVPENGSIHGSHSQNGTIEGNNTLQSSSNDAWKTWTLSKGGLSHFEAAEVLPTQRRKLSQHDDIASVQNDVQMSSNGVAVSDYPIDGVLTERDEIHSRLQTLELDLSAALKTLRSRFDEVLSDVSNSNGATVLDDISDDWEFEETKVMKAQEELRSIRAKIAVLEGKIALEIIERNKIIEDKQRRLDEVEKALSELRTVCIMWANPASDVLVVGSFDGWTSQSLPGHPVFSWLWESKELNTKTMLRRRNLFDEDDAHCILCTAGVDEDLEHFFFDCPFSKRCWEKTGMQWNTDLSLYPRIAHARQQQNVPFFMEVVIIAAWEIWKIRNDRVFNNGQVHVDTWFANFKNQCLLQSL